MSAFSACSHAQPRESTYFSRDRNHDMSYKSYTPLVASFIFMLVSAACTGDTAVNQSTTSATPATAAPASPLRTMAARFAPADIGADLSPV